MWLIKRKGNLCIWDRTFDFKSDRYCTGSGTKYRTWKSMEWSGVSCGIYIGAQYTGGYHADTYVRCNAAFVLTYLLTVGIWIFCRVHDLKVAVWFILLGAYIIWRCLHRLKIRINH